MTNQTANYYGDVYQWNRTVSTDGQDTPTEYYLPNWTDLVLAGLFTMLIIVTIVGNTLVIIAVITTRRLRSVTNCFVSSLAAADLLVGLAVMPPAVVLQLTGGTWELGEVLCDSWVSLDVLLCTASILSLCAISIDR
ncbi:histamine H2 receptor-like isoform X1 [Ceratina calcarata]|uniref:Histamine H2 receptor-like isoform X1 n=1 Tax=Ceratina calcarata TaxID=156304 RepID=A0AAJ7N3C6_9HYME|nr:histamine H2 receptor-like isoform X1 [Ceratina calcarata]